MTESLGTKIAVARKSLGLTQEQLGKRLHVTRQTVSNWENNRGEPDYNTLRTLAEILHLEPTALFANQLVGDFALQTRAEKASGIDETKSAASFTKRYPFAKRLIIGGSLLALLLLGLLFFQQGETQAALARATRQRALFMAELENNPHEAYVNLWVSPNPVAATQYITDAKPSWNYRLYLQEINRVDITLRQVERVLFLADGTCTDAVAISDHFGFYTYWGSKTVHGGGVRSLTLSQEQEKNVVGAGIAVHVIDEHQNELVFRTYLELLP